MVVAGLAGAWAAIVLLFAAAWRPPAERLGALETPTAPTDRRAAWGSALAAVGRAAVRVWYGLRRRPPRPVDDDTARRLGVALVAGGAGTAWAPGLGATAGVVAWMLPAALARRARLRHLATIEADLPEVVDLVALAVGAGLNVALAVEAVGRRGAGPLAAELAQVSEEAARGRRLGDALEDLPLRAGEAVRPLVAALVAGERYGAPLGEGLERLASETRAAQRRRCETAARRVPVTLLFPLVTCILPAFALLTVAPLLASGLGSLRL